MDIDKAIKDIAAWYHKNHRKLNEVEFAAIIARHTTNKAELKQLMDFLGSDVGSRYLAAQIRNMGTPPETKLGPAAEPPYDKPFTQALAGELMKEMRNPRGLLTPGRFPKRDAALAKLKGPVTITQLHDDGDLTIRHEGKLYVVTTEGEIFEEKSLLRETPAGGWITGAEPIASIPGEPIAFHNVKRDDLSTADAMLFDTDAQPPKYYIKNKAGLFLENPRARGKVLFDSAAAAKDAFAARPTFLPGAFLKTQRPEWAGEFERIGGFINADGTVTLYHATTKEKAEQILREGVLRKPADAPDSYGVYVSSSASVAEDYGDGTVVKVRAWARDLHPDDVKGRRMDFRIPTKAGVYRPVTVERSASARVLENGRNVDNKFTVVDERGLYIAGPYRRYSDARRVADISPEILISGRDIAVAIGNGLIYDGPYMDGARFRTHSFTDPLTGGSIACKNLEDCKKSFVALRKRFGAEPPSFVSYLKEPMPASVANLVARSTVRSAEIMKERLAEGKRPPWQMHVFGPVGSLLVPRETENPGAEEAYLLPPKYYDLLPLLDSVPTSLSLLVEPEATGRKIDEILERLKQGVESIQSSAVFRQFLITMSKFHDYSIGNQILIMIGRPNATRVAGFNDWKKLGRYVRAGEKGIPILAPVMPPKFKVKREGEEEEVEIQPRPHYFKVVYVFDVSQTEGKPLAEVAVPVLTGAANEQVFARLLAHDMQIGVPVSFESKPDQDPEIKGWLSGKSIWVRPEESRAQQLKTLIHENAHYYTERVFMIPRADAETIAESVAFVVGAHFGFDTGTRSFPYVAIWSREKKVLDRNLLDIRKISDRMIHLLEE